MRFYKTQTQADGRTHLDCVYMRFYKTQSQAHVLTLIAYIFLFSYVWPITLKVA